MDLAQLLADQDGVVCRRQVLASGGVDHDVRRRLRRREWAQVHTGVYVHHTGPLTWRQLHVLLPAQRRVDPVLGVRAVRRIAYEQVVHPSRRPRTVTVEHAALTVAVAARTVDAAVAALADVCQSRLTTPERLRRHLESQSRVARRGLLTAVLDDVSVGAWSALERRYLAQVERAHGLPGADRQRRVRPCGSAAYRDVDYRARQVVVELDGRLAHGAPGQRWADLDRDLAALVGGDITLRVGWAQVLQPCRLAGTVGRVLAARGWTGRAHACSRRCPAGGSPSPGDRDPPR
ncbi:hypothetical protein [Nocardioides nanhaiensis]|uniref:DUF559 domain-containing protein n=1 Tax=Nocardioides nanhaiensis TaxID=1476871 RepID=A0ABP8W9V9_9ACTN